MALKERARKIDTDVFDPLLNVDRLPDDGSGKIKLTFHSVPPEEAELMNLKGKYREALNRIERLKNNERNRKEQENIKIIRKINKLTKKLMENNNTIL